jgi:hypothetical protein
MNRLLLVFLILLGAGAVAAAFWLLNDKERRIIEAQIPADVLETVDTSRYSTYPVVLQRYSKQDCVLVVFPADLPSNVTMQIYDSAGFEKLKSGMRNVAAMEYPLRMGKWMKKPLVNLSGQPDGDYFTRLSYCNFGGFIQISLKTAGPAEK